LRDLSLAVESGNFTPQITCPPRTPQLNVDLPERLQFLRSGAPLVARGSDVRPPAMAVERNPCCTRPPREDWNARFRVSSRPACRHDVGPRRDAQSSARRPSFSFYEWSGDVPGPGVLLRSEPLPQDLTLENASKSERILYSSTNGLDDKMHIAVRALCSGRRAIRRPAAGRSSLGRTAPSVRRRSARPRSWVGRSATRNI